MHTRIAGFLIAALTIMGCTNSHDPEPPVLEGSASYQLELQELQTNFGTASLADAVRLDIHIDGERVHARLSPSWRGSFLFEGDADETPLQLVAVEDAASMELTPSGYPLTLLVDTIEIDALIADLELLENGDVTFSGRTSELFGGVGEDVSGSFTAGRDDIAPMARVVRHNGFGSLLPWEGIDVRLSEPVAREAIETRLELSRAYEVEFPEGDDFPGEDHVLITELSLRPIAWWDGATELALSLTAGFEDLSGNAGQLTQSSYDVAHDPTAEPGNDFETPESSDVEAFGVSEVVLPPELACDGCLALYRDAFDSAGLYAQLESDAPFTTIDVRIRVIGHESPEGFGFSFHNTEIRLEAAELDSPQAVSVSQSFISEEEESDIPTGIISDSGFVTVTLELAGPMTEAGLSLAALDGNGFYNPGVGRSTGAGASPPPPMTPASVLVDSITLR